MEYKRGFENLEVCKQARVLRRFVSDLTKRFPASELYSLTSQIKRASRSITANIAEGYGRFHYQENIQFCRKAEAHLKKPKTIFIQL